MINHLLKNRTWIRGFGTESPWLTENKYKRHPKSTYRGVKFGILGRGIITHCRVCMWPILLLRITIRPICAVLDILHRRLPV